MFACIHILRSEVMEKPSEKDATSRLLLDYAATFSPTSELPDPNTVVFNINGLGILYGEPPQIFQAITTRIEQSGLTRRGEVNIAVAQTADAARLFALSLPGMHFIPPEATAERLADLDLGLIPLPEEDQETVENWGIRTLGEFAALPEAGLIQRLGSQAIEWQRLARGAVKRPLLTGSLKSEFKEELELEHPIELLDALLFALGRCTNSLCARLWAAGLSAGEIYIQLKLDDKKLYKREIKLPFPLRASKPLLRIIQLELEKQPPQAAIRDVCITVQAVEPRYLQHELFIPAMPEPEKLELTLARIRAVVGEENVGVPELIDSHHPQPFRLSPHLTPHPVNMFAQRHTTQLLAVRYFRPPLASEVVQSDSNQPARLRARGISGRVINAAGPWKGSGNWWSTDTWNREDWDVALSDGLVYRLFKSNGSWFIEGAYD
jgi:protein ImuB